MTAYDNDYFGLRAMKMPPGSGERNEKGRRAALSNYDQFRATIGNGARFTSRDCGVEGLKGAGDGWFNDAKRKGGTETGRLSQSGSKSPARKAASAMIAKIPLVLSSWIAKAYYPDPGLCAYGVRTR